MDPNELERLIKDITEDGEYPLIMPHTRKKMALKLSSNPEKVRALEIEKLIKTIGELASEGKDFSAEKEQLAVLKNSPLPEREITELHFVTDKLVSKVTDQYLDPNSELSTLIAPLMSLLFFSTAKDKSLVALGQMLQIGAPTLFTLILQTCMVSFFLRQVMQNKGLSLTKIEKNFTEKEINTCKELNRVATSTSMQLLGLSKEDSDRIGEDWAKKYGDDDKGSSGSN